MQEQKLRGELRKQNVAATNLATVIESLKHILTTSLIYFLFKAFGRTYFMSLGVKGLSADVFDSRTPTGSHYCGTIYCQPEVVISALQSMRMR